MVIRTVTTPATNYVTPKQLVERNPFLTIGGVRHALFHRHHNGLDKHVIHVGRHLALDEDGVLQWLRERGDAPLSGNMKGGRDE